MARIRVVGPSGLTPALRAAAVRAVRDVAGWTADPLTLLDRRQMWLAVSGRGTEATVLGVVTFGEAYDADGHTVRAWLLGTAVPKHARGLGLQRRLTRAGLAALKRTARKQGSGFVVETYALMKNHHSRDNLEACGFEQAYLADGCVHYSLEVHP